MKAVQFSIVTLLSSLLLHVAAFTCVQNGVVTRTSRTSALFSTTEDPTPPAAAASPAPASPAPASPAPASSAPASSAPASRNIETNQPKYGKEMPLPDTYVRCGRCGTSFALKMDDLGEGKGLRVECSICGHNWFQSRERLFNLNDGRELVPLPQVEVERIGANIAKGRDPDFIGDTKFFVGNLDFAVEESDIRTMFAEKGEVGEVSLVMGPDGRSRGFAFVTMMDRAVLDECLKLDGLELKGRAINVKEPN